MSRSLHRLMLLALLILVACAPPPGPPAPAPPLGAGDITTRVQLHTPWVAGPEAAALRALTDLYERAHPGIDIVNAPVAGGSANARVILRTRLTGGDPPDIFQARLGRELTDAWLFPWFIEDLDQLYQSEGWDKVMPQGLLRLLTKDGHLWSVPAGVRRANVLWYNKRLLADNDLQPPQTLDDFFRVAHALTTQSITPLALGDSDISSSSLLFENVLIGTLGADKYEGLWTGRTNWKGPEVKLALEDFARLFFYTNPDHAKLTASEAIDLVRSGRAAMTFAPDGLDPAGSSGQPGSDLGWSVAPGTFGIFLAYGDVFAMPRGARNRLNAIDWLRIVGSKEGQAAFNSTRGTICARTDCDMQSYSPFARSAARDLATLRIVPSLSGGAAANTVWLTTIEDIISVFVSNRDRAAAQAKLYDACLDQKVCR